jgi:hypothetical protein
MPNDSFWLIIFEEDSVGVSFIKLSSDGYSIIAIGPETKFSLEPPESLIQAVDHSLSQASEAASLSENDEPSRAAFIIPSFWVGPDGKISSHHFKQIETLCKKLKLQPLGFVSHEDALIEDVNSQDGFPPSFILINSRSDKFSLSLVYLGKVKEQIQKPLADRISPQLVEQALIELETQSTLPPQIIFLGQVDEETLNSFKDYDWVGKKNIETFLHFPEVKAVSPSGAIDVYCRVILHQSAPKAPIPLPTPQPDFSVDSPPADKLEIEDSEDDESQDHPVLASNPPSPDPSPDLITQLPQEVDLFQLGFEVYEPKTVSPPVSEVLPPEPPPVSIESLNEEAPKPVSSKITLPRLPKINPPRLKLSLPSLRLSLPKKLKTILVGLLIASPLFALVPLLFTRADITLFLTPYSLDKQFDVILDPAATAVSQSATIVPVTKKDLKVSVSANIETTGVKTVGEKSKGEVVIFNKLDKVQNLPKGTILADSTGKKFETLNLVSVASSSSDLEEGVIKLGQTKTIVQALDIGPEYNISKDTRLSLKDFSETSLIAKTSQAFVGGTKEQISAVSQADVKNIQEKIKESISQATEEKINNDLNSLSGAIKDSLKIKQQKTEISREVGEQAQELTATAQADISIFVLDPQKKPEVLTAFLSGDESYNQSTKDTASLNLDFSAVKNDGAKVTAKMAITGQLLPAVNLEVIKSAIKGKSLGFTRQYLQSQVTRVYNFSITTNFPYLETLNPLPINPRRIQIETKTESL